MENVHGIVYRLDTSIPWIQSLKAAGKKVLYLSNYSMKVARDNEDAMDFLSYMDAEACCPVTTMSSSRIPLSIRSWIDKYDLGCFPSACFLTIWRPISRGRENSVSTRSG